MKSGFSQTPGPASMKLTGKVKLKELKGRKDGPIIVLFECFEAKSRFTIPLNTFADPLIRVDSCPFVVKSFHGRFK